MRSTGQNTSIDNAQLESDGAASLKSAVTDSKTACPRFIISVAKGSAYYGVRSINPALLVTVLQVK